MIVNIKDERHIDFSVFEITLGKQDLANLLLYGTISKHTSEKDKNCVRINLEDK